MVDTPPQKKMESLLQEYIARKRKCEEPTVEVPTRKKLIRLPLMSVPNSAEKNKPSAAQEKENESTAFAKKRFVPDYFVSQHFLAGCKTGRLG